ncbi:MAG: S8 family serine peptidase [bacterium]|nr:S8 family serine peptidase [bacterium]
MPAPSTADTPASGKLHPALVRVVEESSQPVKAWVFFADKGVVSEAEYQAALRQVEQSYNRRALQRRARRGDNVSRQGALFDERDLPVVEAYVDGVAATGARVHVTSRWLNAVSVWANRAQLDAIADLPFVRALQPVARARRIDNRLDVQELGPASQLHADTAAGRGGLLDYGLSAEQLNQINLINLHAAGATGAGVVIGVLDTGFRRGHVAFNHALKPLTVVAEYDFINDDGNTDIEPGDPSAQHFHGTLILGTLAAFAPGDLVGGAYDASYILCKTEDTTAEYPAEEDNYVAGLEFIEANGGDVVNSSLGYIDWYTQADLDGQTAVTTIAVNAATANGVHCCTSAGNNGNDADPTTSRLLAPADAFRVVACGAVDATGAIASFSADGPTADGRVKPEVLARGVSTFTIGGYDDTSYSSASGTSLSAPLVAGAVACLTQAHPGWTVDQLRNGLIRTADDFVANGTHDPLFVRGYGVINAYAAGLDCNFNAVLDECDVDCGTSGGPCDVAGCGGSADCNSDGIPDDCEPDCDSNGVADGCDIAACAPNDSACQDCDRNGVPDECDVPFPQQGRIALDAPNYLCEATATITVNDCGLNVDPAVEESVQILVTSDSEPAGEPLLLTETGADTGTFEGSIPLSATDGAGVLLVGHGDTISAVYVDADDGLGGSNVSVSAQAGVDCGPPVVSNVQAIATGPFDATVSFTTDEPAIATVRYGSVCGLLGQQVVETQYLTSFVIPLSGLTESTTYSFAIDVEDALTNAATDDNGGACYTFDTPEIPNYFTEHFEADDNDLDFRSILFTPDGSPDVYTPCVASILNLPSDPTGGTVLNFAVVDFVPVTLLPGESVSLYGVSYSTFFVGAYGYVTFGAGDDESFDTLAHHFDLPRISALFELIDPSAGGTVSWKRFGDRVAVTWLDVPSFFQQNSNTFQIDMFFDGRIRLSYANVDDEDGLAGLSAGTGLVPGFTETDLSALGGCAAAPPTVADTQAATPVNTPVQIALPAIDEGLPDPPGALTYTIVSLPARGTLSDPGAGTITTVPYALVGRDGLVDFVPQPWYAGPDAFHFLVNDGGVPPTGGDSNVATVTLTIGSVQSIYSFDLDVDPGWNTQGQWAHGVPTGGGSHDGDPTSGYTGQNVYGYNLNGDYPNDLTPMHLTTTSLDCSRLIDTELHFQRWLGVESSLYDHATVSASDDGVFFDPVWDHDGGTISDTAWMAQSYDISAEADEQPAVFLRWTMGATDSIVTYPGWNIDDVEIRAIEINIPGDYDGNGLVDFGDLPAFLFCYFGPNVALPPGCEQADLDLDGDADLGDWGLFQEAVGDSGR